MSTRRVEGDGRAYGRQPGVPDPELTQVGPGTPGGELLRRYWQPIALASEATTVPTQIRRFGEDLILFRNGKGEAGLLTPRCIHRGASLFYGSVEDDGIRCCYHGWKFGCQGQVLDQPYERDGGRRKLRLRQPWYPVVEQFGAIWAYLGPAEKQPLFPSYSILEDVEEDEEIVSNYLNTGKELMDFPARFNWFQAYENGVDQHHIPVLHKNHSGSQITDPRFDVDPDVTWEISDNEDSVLAVSRRNLEDGATYIRIEQVLIPNIFALAPMVGDGISPHLWYFIPIDGTTHIQLEVIRKKKKFVWDLKKVIGYGPDLKLWRDMTPEERQLNPSDQEAQESQGPVTLHSEDNLAATDAGVIKLRRLFKRHAKVVAEGGDPPGVAFEEGERRIVITGRSWVEAAQAAVASV